MLALATSDVVAVRTFGIGAAVGVMVDFGLSLVFVPTLLELFDRHPAAPPPQESWFIGPLTRVARFSSRRPALVASTGVVLAAVAMLGMTRLHVDTNHINFFAADHPLHRSADLIDRELSGIYSFQILVEGQPETMQSPDMLHRMERLGRRLETLPYVRKVVSLADYVKRVNRELNDGRDEAAVVPDDPQAVAQELFVFSLADEGRRELAQIVASDFSRTQISVKLASMSSDLVFEQINAAERLARAEFEGSGATVTVTGAGRLFSTLDHYLVVSQVTSFGTAFLTVFGVIFLVFRSLKFGLLAVVPNLFPVLAVLGAMGWLDISMNVATVMLASIALGVVDDDTVHFISRFRRETAAGRTVDAAIVLAATHEGRAALTTALINSCGYGVLMFSEYKPTAWFGLLLGLTMAIAFLAEVFILPATIKLAPGLFPDRSRELGNPAEGEAGLAGGWELGTGD
jgi:predicted RND superfamily exporter protein